MTVLVTVWARRPDSPVWSAAGDRTGPIVLPPDEAERLADRLRGLGLLAVLRVAGAGAPLAAL